MNKMKHDIIEIDNFITDDEASILADFRKYNSPHSFKGTNDFFQNKSFPITEVQDANIICMASTAKYRIAHTIKEHYKLPDTLYPDFTDLVQWFVGDSMDPHGDNAYYPSGEPNYVSHRTYSALIYLNDDYQDGQTFFVDGPEIEVKAGKMIAFPAGVEYAHGVKKITNGVRYTLAFWYTDSRDNYEF